MTTTQDTEAAVLPDEVARKIVLPEGHTDLASLFDTYKWIRDNMPLAMAVVEGFDPMWLVSKHADLMEVENSPKVFTAGGGDHPGSHNPILVPIAGDEFTKSLTGGSLRVMDATPYMDPPEHSTVKESTNDALRPASMKKFEAQIRELARAAVDRLADAAGEIDIVEKFAAEFPLRSVMTLVGFSQDEYARMYGLTQEFFGTQDPETRRADVEELSPSAAAEQWAAATRDYNAFFDTYIEDRRVNPREDLATVVATAKQANGEYFPKGVCYGRFMEFATAGHDTTTATIAGAMHLFAQRPDVLARVKADLSAVPDFVNETVRWVAPVKHFMRRALVDHQMRGQTIKAGDRLMSMFQSGCRDEEAIDHPDEFDIDRKPNRHLGFGYGTHICLGQHLAKLEMKVLWEELLPRLESVEITGQPKYTQTNFVGGLRRLPAKVTIS